MRHGQSAWNLENRFTGWTDVDLSGAGRDEARAGRRAAADEGFEFDAVYTSVLKRAIRTAWIVLDEMDRMWLPVSPDWRLNERHYGALQGSNKAETAAKFGDDQVKIWRRSYDIPPPPLAARRPAPSRATTRATRHRAGRAAADREPQGDGRPRRCRSGTSASRRRRSRPAKVLVVAHGNRLRAMVKMPRRDDQRGDRGAQHPDRRADAVRAGREPAPASGRRFLGDADAIEAAARAVADQAR